LLERRAVVNTVINSINWLLGGQLGFKLRIDICGFIFPTTSRTDLKSTQASAVCTCSFSWR